MFLATTLQYKIPQNVGIEDKIVGPLTLRQLIILAIGFGLSYILFTILNRIYELNIIEYSIIILPGLLSAAFALIRINDISLTKYLLLFLEFSIKPKKRVWDHRGILNIVSPNLSSTSTTQKNKKEPIASNKKNKNLQELSKILDSGSFDHIDKKTHEDIDDAHDDDLVTQAYFGNKSSETDNIYWRTKSSHLEMLEIFSKLPVTKLKEGTKETEIAKKEIKKVKNEVDELKKTKRTRKRRKSANPVREKRINTIKKPTSPKKVIEKKVAPKKPLIHKGKSGEFNLDHLSDSDIDTIEINLD